MHGCGQGECRSESIYGGWSHVHGRLFASNIVDGSEGADLAFRRALTAGICCLGSSIGAFSPKLSLRRLAFHACHRLIWIGTKGFVPIAHPSQSRVSWIISEYPLRIMEVRGLVFVQNSLPPETEALPCFKWCDETGDSSNFSGWMNASSIVGSRIVDLNSNFHEKPPRKEILNDKAASALSPGVSRPRLTASLLLNSSVSNPLSHAKGGNGFPSASP